MNAGYDEDLSENHFLRELKDEHKATFQRAVQEGWVVCVPRSGSFVSRTLHEDEINVHILVPEQDLSVTRFCSLNGSKILLEDQILHVEHDDAERYSSRLLFEEIFYNDDLHKYSVWCIERPLKASMYVSDNCISVITNLQEAINFLQVELLNGQLRDDLEIKIKDFLYINKNLQRKSMQEQKDLVYELYADCLGMLMENATLKKKITNNKQYQWNIRVSLETYILYALKNILIKSLSACTVSEDAYLNKIIRNLNGIQLNDLRVRSDLQSRIHGGKIELARLDNFVTVLGKIECLRRTVNYISHGISSSVTSDDLLPVLVFLVINVGLSNWTAQLYFMRQFRLSSNSTYETDEISFLITSLEAVIMYIKSGVICGEDKCVNNSDKYDQLMNQSERTSICYLFACIKNGNLSEVKRILTYDRSSQVNDVMLCHPLCTCASCERNWTKQRDLNTCPKDDKGLTPLHVAVLHDQIVIVDFLLDHDTDINVVDSDGMTALHHTCIKGHQNILLLMLHANADPTAIDSRGNTPLHLAVDRGHESCVKALLYLSEHMRAPIDVNIANDNGDTPLHLAARWGYRTIVDILLEYGANCKTTNKKGQTPSMITYSETIAELIRCNAASGNICNDVALFQRRIFAQPCQPMPFQQQCHRALLENKNPSHVKNYVNVMQHRMMDKLLAAIVDGDICLACYYLGLEVYRERPSSARANLCHHPLCDCERCPVTDEDKLERKQRQRALTINACNDLGETALHLASATGRTKMVQLLLDAGANVNVMTKSEGRTPLHLACLNDHVDAARLLLNCATCNIDAKDHDGDTPLHLATMAGNVKPVNLLIRHGAFINARNLQNKTPLQQVEEKLSTAFSTNHAGILKILKQNSIQPPGD
ncbi:ankyrin repeat domain-containing protein 27-like [Pogonomyrmex barbatus]|uniref:Ankyrin repeat domain-containing protein 27-like n=1 Tax=Pogonomyrmex barbatus TaxID=144034 RepID=A0A6I9X903_9HYME|nr:ankyrin repeat domain-containing protein 27-like [Pogonomyrmex barbatus]